MFERVAISVVSGLFFVGVALFSSNLSGCGETLAPTPATRPTLVERPTSPPAARAAPSPTPQPAAPVATRAEVPASAATPSPQPLRVVDQSFQPQMSGVAYDLSIENPNQGLTADDVSYEVRLLDGGGKELGRGSGILGAILPAEKAVAGGSVYVSATGTPAAKTMDVKVKSAGWQPAGPPNQLALGKVSVMETESGALVTGVVQNGYPNGVDNVRACAVAYDAGGNVAGGDCSGSVPFILSGGHAGVAFHLSTGGLKVARAEISARVGRIAQAGATVTPAPYALKSVAQGFAQTGQDVQYGLVVENPNAGQAAENAMYQVILYDKSGAVLDTGSGYLFLLLPGQKLAAAGRGRLANAALAVDHMEVELWAPRFVPTGEPAALTAEKVRLLKGDDRPLLTGFLRSPYKVDVQELLAGAVVYDAAGKIIGGGMTNVLAAPAGGLAPFSIELFAGGDPARWEVYAAPRGLSSLAPPATPAAQELPAPATPVVRASGFGQSEGELAYGFVVENPDTQAAQTSAAYALAVYSADGSLLDVYQRDIAVLLPGQKLGVAGHFPLPAANMKAARVEVLTRAGYPKAAGAWRPLEVADVKLQDQGAGSWLVTAGVKNPMQSDFPGGRSFAVAFDAAGKIIGGGEGYVGSVPAGGTGEINGLYILAPGKIDRVDVYAGYDRLP